MQIDNGRGHGVGNKCVIFCLCPVKAGDEPTMSTTTGVIMSGMYCFAFNCYMQQYYCLFCLFSHFCLERAVSVIHYYCVTFSLHRNHGPKQT